MAPTPITIEQADRLVKYLSWIITLPLLAIAVIFAVQHRERVELDLWPLPMQVEPPLYLLVLLAIFVGFMIGGAVTWVSQGRHRRRARERAYQVEALERELATTRQKLEQAQAEASRPQAPAYQAPPTRSDSRALAPARTGS